MQKLNLKKHSELVSESVTWAGRTNDDVICGAGSSQRQWQNLSSGLMDGGPQCGLSICACFSLSGPQEERSSVSYFFGQYSLGPDRACKMRAPALYCELGLFVGLGVYLVKLGSGFYLISQKFRPAGFAQNPGLRGLGLIVFLVKAQARPLRPWP
jgi:hypothetical protein